MKLHHLSATSARMFEACEAQWRARYEGKGLDASGDAASLGTAIHATLEDFVDRNGHLVLAPEAQRRAIADLYDRHYWQHLPTAERYDEGRGLVLSWLERQDWSGRRVLNLEQRLAFDLHTRYGEIPMVYVIDRLDQLDDGTLEVVDYKTGVWTLNYDQLRTDVQARTYATAVWAEAADPKPSKVWVTFDYLRAEPTGVAFSGTECEAHYRYLVRLAERVIESDGTRETIGSGCRFCIRKHACGSLARFAQTNPTLTEDAPDLVVRRYQVDIAHKALGGMLKELDDALMAHFDAEETDQLASSNGVTARLSSRKVRQVDSAAVAERVDPVLFARYATLGVGGLDQLLRSEDLSPAQVADLKALVRTRSTAPSIRCSAQEELS